MRVWMVGVVGVIVGGMMMGMLLWSSYEGVGLVELWLRENR